MPALFSSTSSLPSVSLAKPPSALSQALASRTSSLKVAPLSGPIWASAAFRPASSISDRPTNQPSFANRVAAPRPMPLAAPVMKIALRPLAVLMLVFPVPWFFVFPIRRRIALAGQARRSVILRGPARHGMLAVDTGATHDRQPSRQPFPPASRHALCRAAADQAERHRPDGGRAAVERSKD